MNNQGKPSQRQIRFSEVIRIIVSETINKNQILNYFREKKKINLLFVQNNF